MRQQDIIIEQLAGKVTDFIEPVIPYLVIGSKKAVEEAIERIGPDAWEIKKRLWEKLCSIECPELEVAARDMIVAPFDPEVKQTLVQVIIKYFKKNLDLTREILFFMEKEKVQRIMAKSSSINMKQSLNDRDRVLEEFNELLEKFLAKNNIIQDLEQSKILDAEKTSLDRRVETKSTADAKPWQKYPTILDQRTVVENTPIAARMAQLAEIKVRSQSEARDTKTFFSHVSQLKGPVKEEFMEKALDFACNIQYGDLRSETLSLLVPNLEGPKKLEFIKKALYAASDIQDEKERALVISSLTRHLRGPGKEELIEYIFDFSSKIQYGDAKFQILYSLVPHLYGSKNEAIIEKALELVSTIISQYQRIESYSLLLPYLNDQKREKIIEQSLEIAFSLKDKDMTPQALSLIIPYLDGPRQKEVLDKALNLARGIQSESRKAQAFSSLAPYLDEPAE